MKPKILSLLFLLTSIFGCSDRDETNYANTVFTNGNFHLGTADNLTAAAVAIDDGKFVYVGNDASDLTGPDTVVVDLGGRTVIPGIIDAHSHPGFVAQSGQVVPLEDASTKEAMMNSIRDLVAANPDHEVLISGFWPNEFFDVAGPRKEDLDAIEPDRPLIIYDDWAHTVWANSAALEQAGVTSETPDLVPGFAFYQKDEDGEPTGWVTESAASVFLNNFFSLTPDVEARLLAYLEYNRDLGVTTLLDAGNFGRDDEIYAVISRFDKEGRLPLRYHGAYTLFTPQEADTAVDSLKLLGEKYNSENVRIDTLKIFFDGVLETRTAAIDGDYLDTPNNDGAALLSREQVHDIVLQLDEAGLNLHMHAVGNRATTILLDGISAAHDTLTRAPNVRMTICHLELVNDSDIERFRELGVAANFTPHWWVGGDRGWVEQGIAEQAMHMQRGQTFIDTGVMVTFSSDITDQFEWQRERANPYLGMQLGHNRQDVDVGIEGDIFPPKEERVSRLNLLRGYTSNGAYALGRNEDIGAIEVGRMADLVVLDRDLFAIDRYDIHNTKPVAVVMNGAIVYGELPAAP